LVDFETDFGKNISSRPLLISMRLPYKPTWYVLFRGSSCTVSKRNSRATIDQNLGDHR